MGLFLQSDSLSVAKDALAEAISFIKNQAAIEIKAIKGTQIKPAFCKYNALPLAVICGAPPTAPKIPAPITKGTTNCMTETPKLPKPAFKPNAVPCLFAG